MKGGIKVIDTILILFRSGIALVVGMAISLLFSGVYLTRKGKLATTILIIFLFLLQYISWRLLGLHTTMQLYPFITHIPFVLFIALYFKRPWTISLSSVLTTYLCCQIPRWIGSVASATFGSLSANHIGYSITICVVYFILKKYIAESVKQVMDRSTRSCLMFAAVPFLYYLFDYATTVYTDLLYSGAREAVQFTPSVICTFYLVFVLQYYNESHKQELAQRERDLFASQLQQAQVELDTMRQMEKGTAIYRHDMRHHLSLIGGLAADGDLNKINEYLAITVADIDALTPKRYCENETVNLILSCFEARAKKGNVALHVDVKLPENLCINDTELCSLLSNALENAITAAAQIEDEKLRKVYIQGKVNGGKLIISTENAYAGQIELQNELPKTRQKEGGHGFGIKSMVSIVERYGGLYSIETEGGIFILRLMLPLGK